MSTHRTRIIWVRHNGQGPGAPVHTDHRTARKSAANDYAAAHGRDLVDLSWEDISGQFVLFCQDNETDWFIEPVTVNTEEA